MHLLLVPMAPLAAREHHRQRVVVVEVVEHVLEVRFSTQVNPGHQLKVESST